MKRLARWLAIGIFAIGACANPFAIYAEVEPESIDVAAELSATGTADTGASAATDSSEEAMNEPISEEFTAGDAEGFPGQERALKDSSTDASSAAPSVEDAEVVDAVAPAADVKGRIVQNINAGWEFDAGTTDFSGWTFPVGGSSGMVDLPHSWEYTHPAMSFIPQMNTKTVTYSKTIDVAAYQGRKLFIKFYGSSRNTVLLIDGVNVGTHVGGYSAFTFDITDYVQGKSSVSVVARVTNIDTVSIPINVDYTQWAGIYRDVELISPEAQHVSLEDYGSDGFYIDSAVSGGVADISIRVQLSNSASFDAPVTLRASVLDAGGNLVRSVDVPSELSASSTAVPLRCSLRVSNPHLWNGVADPYLYTVSLDVLDRSGAVLDHVERQYGVRTFEIRDGAAYLNGSKIEIHGVGYHQDRQDRGNAVTAEDMQQDLDMMLDMGVNAVRVAHYPHDRQFFEMADRAGVLVYTEIPYYLLYSKAESYRLSVLNQLKEMIRQSYNNTSVVMWGVQNEVGWNPGFAQFGSDFNVTQDEVVAFNKDLVELAQIEDPNRLIVQATIDSYDTASLTNRWSASIDLTGVNLYDGFKTPVASAGTSGKQQLAAQINEKLDRYKSIYQTPSIMVSEYGSGANTNHHWEVDENFAWNGNEDASHAMHTEEYQGFVLETFWDTISKRDDVPASFVWNMFDFSCYRDEGGISRMNTKGLVNYDHATQKDAYYFFKAVWNDDEPFAHITSKRFTQRHRAEQDIKVYSNCDDCVLYVNGKQVGCGVKTQDGVFVWDSVALDSRALNSIRVVATRDGVQCEDVVEGITVPQDELVGQAHVSELGWLDENPAGATLGTIGRSLNLESIRLDAEGPTAGDIELSAHVQDIGWRAWSAGKAGTTGQARAIEAIRIRLTGDLASRYDIYYRAHIADSGWLGWAKNGEPAGSQGQAKPMQALQVVLVEKGADGPWSNLQAFSVASDRSAQVVSTAHVEDIGWMTPVSGGETCGTVGKNKQLEALRMTVENVVAYGDIQVSAHVSNIGWQGWTAGSGGTVGQGNAMEAVKIKLTGDIAGLYDVYYRAHIADAGWLGWAKNGESAGSEGMAKDMQALQIVLVEKGGAAPGATEGAFLQPMISYRSHVSDIGWQAWVHDGALAGTTGQAKSMEAIRIKLDLPSDDLGIRYRAHSAQIGWQDWVDSGELGGTTGRSLQLEALQIELTGADAGRYDIRYRTHVAEIGWQGWVSNGETAGTTGQGRAIEALEIRVVER